MATETRRGMTGTDRGRTDDSRSAGRFYESASRRMGERRDGSSMQRAAGRDEYAENGEGGLGTEAERGDWERWPRGLREPSDRSDDRDSGGRIWPGDRRQSYTSTRPGNGYAAERRERRGRWQREALCAREVMTKNVRTVTPDGSLREAAEIMKDENVGIVPVVDEQHRLVGLVTDRDIVIRTLAEGRDPTGVRAGEIMTDDIQGVTPDESLIDVTRLMGDRQIRRVPVVDRDDRLVGIISIADVATRADYDEDLQEALEEISARRSFWSRIWS